MAGYNLAIAGGLHYSGCMRNRSEWVMEAAAICLFTALILSLVWHLGRALAAWQTLVPSVLFGYLGADLASGVVHWFCDNFFEEDSPLIGPLFIHPFREHHRDPEGMTHHGFLELTGNSCLAMIPALAAVLWWRDSLGVFSKATVVFLCLASFATNQFHKWAHARTAPAVVLALQRWRIILPPAHHRRHHENGYSGAYCITNGWMSGSLDYLLRRR
jgi:ubiquitin-conjugating enzyme E2 variant